MYIHIFKQVGKAMKLQCKRGITMKSQGYGWLTYLQEDPQ